MNCRLLNCSSASIFKVLKCRSKLVINLDSDETPSVAVVGGLRVKLAVLVYIELFGSSLTLDFWSGLE